MAVRRVSQPTSVQVVREAEALATGALALFLVLSLLSYTADVPRSNLGGPSATRSPTRCCARSASRPTCSPWRSRG
jgi:hypothetical protein